MLGSTWRRIRKNVKWPSFRTLKRKSQGYLAAQTSPFTRRPLGRAELQRIRQEIVDELHGELNDFLASSRRLVFSRYDRPEISIVIVLLNQAQFTLACLRALLREAEKGPSIEVVLVDNGSSDRTGDLLARIDGAHIIRNAQNAGFPRGCNQGADVARGRVVCLLNNDAFVRPGALGAALATLDDDATIGAVGGRAILPGDRLQEAGCIVWSDGTALGYGRGWPPERGEAMFRRDVDYCSAAFLLTPLLTWRALGGLDERYSPAYYEDTDFCMRIWQRGLRVVYEPDAAFDHIEHGSEASPGAGQARTARNHKLFRSRHAQALRRWHLPPAEANILTARMHRSRARPSLLVIDNEVPIPTLGQGHPRALEMLRSVLQHGWSVTFFGMHQQCMDWQLIRAYIPKEIELIGDRTHRGLAQFLCERAGAFDAILVSRPDNQVLFRKTLDILPPHILGGARRIYDAEALFAKRTIAKAEISGAALPPSEAEAMIDREIALTEGVDAVICVSENEAAEFRRRVKIPVYLLSHGITVRRSTPDFAHRSGFLFIGRLLEQEAPNFQGLAWFVKEVWPKVRARLPDAELSVVGHVREQRDELISAGINIAGPVDDLTPFYNAARVFVAPIRFAAGVPTKIVEASAVGLPTVATTLMAAQLGWQHGRQIMASDEAIAMADACVTLNQDEAVWSAVRAEAQQAVEQEHGLAEFRRKVGEILDPGQAEAGRAEAISSRLLTKAAGLD